MKQLFFIGFCILFFSFPSLSYAKNIYKEGKASFYTVKSSSSITANGEKFNENAFTCAIWNIPFNTFLKVTNIKNGKFVIVKVNDRGPHKRLKRAIDLTPLAFKSIADLKQGLIDVTIEILK